MWYRIFNSSKQRTPGVHRQALVFFIIQARQVRATTQYALQRAFLWRLNVASGSEKRLQVNHVVCAENWGARRAENQNNPAGSVRFQPNHGENVLHTGGIVQPIYEPYRRQVYACGSKCKRRQVCRQNVTPRPPPPELNPVELNQQRCAVAARAREPRAGKCALQAGA
ncbi:hypothetical protein NPIL_631381 [Nephila pilipes]|uniref:Uncharacterized protein n=1 Tax=Nephila pilipes TaxID=299642 RepID=A0A8X6T833_NEPPI|nr:hypothetical protein NPIL_631381 [Nephila pilipes]